MVVAKKRRSARIDKNFVAQFTRVLARGCGKREWTDFAALAGECGSKHGCMPWAV